MAVTSTGPRGGAAIRRLVRALGVAALALGAAPIHADTGKTPVAVDAGEANVALVQRFLIDVRRAMGTRDEAQIRAVAERYMAADYTQHSAAFKPGRQGYIDGMTKMLALPPPSAPGGPPRDLQFIGNRDFVVWMSESPSAGATRSPYVFNMIRIVDGKFAEHWDSR